MAESKQVVVLHLDLEQAEKFSYGISDVSCWMKGFIAATPDSPERHPYSLRELSDLNIALKRAIEASKK